MENATASKMFCIRALTISADAEHGGVRRHEQREAQGRCGSRRPSRRRTRFNQRHDCHGDDHEYKRSQIAELIRLQQPVSRATR